VLKPFLLRRLKAEVEHSLLPKLESKVRGRAVNSIRMALFIASPPLPTVG
jgi:hypothetical protein